MEKGHSKPVIRVGLIPKKNREKDREVLLRICSGNRDRTKIQRSFGVT